MTKLAIVRQKYRPDGGAERFVASALASLTTSALPEQSRLDITVLTRQWQGDRQPGFQVNICNPLKWGRVSREKGFARAAQALFDDFDIVQSHERIPGCTIFRAGDGVHKCWLDHRARIVTKSQAERMKNDRFHRYVMQAEREMFEHPALKAVICNSQMVKDEISQTFQIDPEIIHVIYNSVDHSKYHPGLKKQFRAAVRAELGIPIDTPTMLYVGSGFERKGLRASIGAIARTQSHLIVIGKDKQQPTYQQLAKESGCAERVHFLGMQPDPHRFYGAADGFIIPTLYDPFPNVILEAMASGLGVITSYTCGGAEIIKNGVNGYACDALDIAALTHATEQFRQPEQARQLGAEANNTVSSFTAEKLSEQLMSLYNRILKI